MEGTNLLPRFWFFSRFWFLSRFCLNSQERRKNLIEIVQKVCEYSDIVVLEFILGSREQNNLVQADF